jgi:hypothetical protein
MDLLKALSLIDLDFTSSLSPVGVIRESLGRDTSFLASLNSQEPKVGEVSDFAARVQALSKVSLDRSYFQRQWVLQEIHNSSHAVLLCGARHLDFSMASLLVIALRVPLSGDGTGNLLPNLDFPALNKLFGAIIMWILRYLDRAYSQKRSLAHQIIELSIRQVSDPRDAIYSLLGMCLPIDLVPKYENSISDCYVDAVRAMISQQQDVVILCLMPRFVAVDESRETSEPMLQALYDKAGIDNMSKEAQYKDPIPSWVPVFSALSLLHGQFVTNRASLEDHVFKAGGAFLTHDSALSVPDRRVLRLDGCFFDKIIDIQARLLCFSGEHFEN